MSPERWQKIKQIFDSAIKCPPEERDSYVSHACSGDNDLRKEVESLIESQEKDGSSIDSLAYRQTAKLLVVDETSGLKPGQVVGTYEIVSFIGRGGMGEVFLAEDKRLHRKVALKLLPTAYTKDAERLRRFEQEARAASALNHPNIITIYEIARTDSNHLIATEFVEGETLRHRLSHSRLSLTESLHIAIQISDALASAHRAGIIHRDIKPENIMIRPDGYVKVLDFGLAKLTDTGLSIAFADAPTKKINTESGVVIGTVGYMSPEQARGQTVDTRSDIFNLGAVIYEMISGQQPFNGETPSDVFAAILKTDPPPLSHLAPEAPPELIRIVNKALKKDPEERYQVVKDLLLDLKSLKEDVDFQTKLNRSAAPDKDHQASHVINRVTAGPPDTSEIKTVNPTITDSLATRFQRHKTGAILICTTLLLVIAGGAIAIYKFLDRGEAAIVEAPEVLRTTQITFSPGLDGFPSLSPDGKSVAYSSNQKGGFEIYLKQLTPGGGELQLTNDGQQNFHPAWSPDGQRIAYYSRNRGGIWLVSAFGGTPKQLTDFGGRPMWSPDGSMIAFQSGIPTEVFAAQLVAPSTIWIVSSQGGAPRQVSQQGNPAGAHHSPAWSPDGKRVAFVHSDFISSTVWSVPISGGNATRVGLGSDPIYARDGRLFFLGAAREGLLEVQLSSTGEPIGTPRSVFGPGSGTGYRNLAISTDGKKIAYSANRTSSNLWSVSVSPVTGEAVGPPSAFTSDTSQRNNLVRFSPDGRKVALARWRPGTSADIWVADADGRNLSQVTNNPAADSQASWFPDGDKLAFLSNRDDQHFKLWSISLATGKEEPLFDLGEGVEYATLSHDAKQIAYNLTQNGALNIWVATVKEGQRRQLTFDNELMGFPCWSPDGQFMAFEMQRGEDAYLMIIPSGGGQPTQLNFDHGKSWPHDWSPDGDKIVFAGQRNGVWNIYWISRSTHIQKQLTNYTNLNAFVRYPAWSPQGNQIVYEYAETTANIWLMELK